MYLCIEKSILLKQVGDMKLYNFEELLDEDYGKVGTPERDAFERSVDEAVQAQQLTQTQLSEKMGVQ